MSDAFGQDLVRTHMRIKILVHDQQNSSRSRWPVTQFYLLGYYGRAIRLLQAAKLMVDDWNTRSIQSHTTKNIIIDQQRNARSRRREPLKENYSLMDLAPCNHESRQRQDGTKRKRVPSIEESSQRPTGDIEDISSSKCSTVLTRELSSLNTPINFLSDRRNGSSSDNNIEDGLFPRDLEGWLKYPGVGDYTAGAVLSIAFNLKVPAIDGNVVR